MENFYKSYPSLRGKISKNAFDLFWSDRLDDCWRYLKRVVDVDGLGEYLSFEDWLIFNFCLLHSGQAVIDLAFLPRPPNRSQIHSLFAYEENLEAIAFHDKFEQSLLRQSQIVNKTISACKWGIDTGCEQAIETGTFLGGSAYLFSGAFMRVDTIEADERLYEAAQCFFKSLSISRQDVIQSRNNLQSADVHCHYGNSGDLLATLLDGRASKCLIFLDAHYSTGITSRAHGVCPLEQELTSIFKSRVDCTVIIDDARLIGTPGYPSFEKLFTLIPASRRAIVKRDQVVIY